MMKYEAFMDAFRAIDANFRDIFARLTSGSGRLILENEEDPFSGGLSFAVQPRDKPVHLLSALSGGEKSLTTLAFIFSIQQHIPAPFYAFDEVDMSLDGANIKQMSAMIQDVSATSQFITVSLRKPMIEGADRILGVSLLPDKRTRSSPGSGRMSEEPVEILVQMAERGGINPWNIDIVEVTDRFLSELERRKRSISASRDGRSSMQPFCSA